MFVYDDLKRISARSASALSLSFVVVMAGLGTPAGDAVAQAGVQQNEILHNEVVQNRQSEFNATEVKPTEINPTDINPTEINPTAINATEINPTAINATKVTPTEISATEITPTEIVPTEITPLQDDFFVKKDQPAEAADAPAQAAEPAAPANAVIAGPDMGPLLLIGGAAVAGAAALAVGLGGLAGTDCGSPPSGFGNAWWAEYSEWCYCEGGTPVVSTNQCVQ